MIRKTSIKLFITFVSLASIFRSLTHLIYANHALSLILNVDSKSEVKVQILYTHIVLSIIPEDSVVYGVKGPWLKENMKNSDAIDKWVLSLSLYHFYWLFLNFLCLYFIWKNSRRGYFTMFGIVWFVILFGIPDLDEFKCDHSEGWDIACLNQSFLVTVHFINCFFQFDRSGHFSETITFWDFPLSKLCGITMWCLMFSLCPSCESALKIEKKKKTNNKGTIRKYYIDLEWVQSKIYNFSPFLKMLEKKSKTNNKMIIKKEFVDPEWIQHACLYGHKDIVKQIVSKFTINVNKQGIDGNTLLHLAVFGNHLSVIQILLSNCNATLNYTIKNMDNMDVIDLAIQHQNQKILKLLLQYHKPQLSNLVFAIESNQYTAVTLLLKNMASDFEKMPDISLQITRFIELNQEIELKGTSKERREICKNNVEVYINHITGTLKSFLKQESNESIDVDINEEKSVEEKSENITTKEKTRDIIAEFECPVCLELMKPPRRIYACSNDHYICSLCLTEQLKECPQCRENFLKNKPSIRLTTERFLSKMLGK